jgi:hypothetical protein
MKFELPPMDTAHPPQFLDVAQCQQWCQALPLGNPIQVLAQLLRQLHLLNQYPLEGTLRLLLLEMLREPSYFVLTENAKKFTGKPLPLAPPEQAAWESSHALWLALVNGYLRCLDDCLSAIPAMQQEAGRICQRLLACLTDDQIDRLRAGVQPDATHWRLVNQVYAVAESLGAAVACGESA